MNYLYIVLLIILAYFLGSIPVGLIIGKVFKKVDIREHNSKNIGATNSTRVLGKKIGIAVLLLDMFKSALIPGVLHILLLLNIESVKVLTHINGVEIFMVYGVVAVVGHAFSVFLKGKGGKGVASSLGLLLAINPYYFLIAVIAFVATIFITKYASMASMIGGIVIVIAVTIHVFAIADYHVLYPRVIFTSIMFLIIMIRHYENIKRLIAGTERKIGDPKQ